jgi:hypothetical protein
LLDAINLFNQVIRESSPEILNYLRTNSTYVASSTALRSARSVRPGKYSGLVNPRAWEILGRAPCAIFIALKPNSCIQT